MMIARIVVSTIAVCAGGVAAHPATVSDSELPPASGPAAHLQTIDLILATSDTGLAPSREPEART
jgi:pilus assembly protein CpaB